MTRVTSSETSSRPTDSLRHYTGRISRVTVMAMGRAMATATPRSKKQTTAVKAVKSDNSSRKRRSSRYCTRCTSLFTFFHILIEYVPGLSNSKSTPEQYPPTNDKIRQATKLATRKYKMYSFARFSTAHNLVTPSGIRVVKQTLLNATVSAKHLAFKLNALVRKLDQDSGAL